MQAEYSSNSTPVLEAFPLGYWNHARFETLRCAVEHARQAGLFMEAFEGAEDLLQKARRAGADAYPGSDYDLATALWTLAGLLESAEEPAEALPLLAEARQRLTQIEARHPQNQAARRMASSCALERGQCLCELGRLEDAAASNEEGIRWACELGDEHGVALGKAQLGTVRRHQHRFEEALEACTQAQAVFERLDEQPYVAECWVHIGLALHESGQAGGAVTAYRTALEIRARLRDLDGQAVILLHLGDLKAACGTHLTEAADFYAQAKTLYQRLENAAGQSRACERLSGIFERQGRNAKARQELQTAIECMEACGQEPWQAWGRMFDLDRQAQRLSAAAHSRRNAVRSYLTYRKEGGAAVHRAACYVHALQNALFSGTPGLAVSLLRKVSGTVRSPEMSAFFSRLQDILHGERALGEGWEQLPFELESEIRLLLDNLRGARK